MRRLLGLAVGIISIISLASTAEAINISSASVQNGLAAVSGGKAASNSSISWEGGIVTTANKNGGFSFSFVVVPTDCVGTLSDGVTTVDVALSNCTPVNATLAPVPRTGQTTCYDATGNIIPCAGTGQDAEFQKGVAWPTPRFTDNGKGTFTDNLTGLVWLKDADCLRNNGNFGQTNWPGALNAVNQLNKDGTMDGVLNCGDTSNNGTHQTDWRLPNIRELLSLLDFAFFQPPMSNAAGTSKCQPNDCPFTHLRLAGYWSSTSAAPNFSAAWWLNFDAGSAGFSFKNFPNNDIAVIAVRGGS